MTYETIETVQREIDMMRKVPKARTVDYNPDRLYAAAVAESQVMLDAIKQAYHGTSATPEANQMAQNALSNLEKELGPTDPIHEVTAKDICAVKEGDGLYRIGPLNIV